MANEKAFTIQLAAAGQQQLSAPLMGFVVQIE